MEWSQILLVYRGPSQLWQVPEDETSDSSVFEQNCGKEINRAN